MAIPASVQTETLTFEQVIKAPAENIYRAFTSRDGLTAWLSDGAYINASVGGYLTLYWYNQGHAFGEYRTLDENQKIVFSWKANNEDDFSQVTVELEGKDAHTHLTLTHAGLSDEAAGIYTERWENALSNLKSVLESGSDTRITERIIIGIIPSNVPEADRERLGLAQGEGTLISQVLDGFSAKEAGLEANDIITHVEGQKLTPTNGIFTVINNLNKKVGDIVSVTFDRQGDSVTKDVQLRGYPIPEAVTTYVELSRRIQAELDANKKTLDEIFAGVSEAEAAHAPAEGEWNANEVLAHLILNERYNQDWIGGFFQGSTPTSYSANTHARIQGVTESYGSNAALVSELKRAWDEVVATIQHIPEENLKNPDILWRISFVANQWQWHTDGHFEQIRNAIKSARQ